MQEKQTEFGRGIKGIKKREGEKSVNSNREQMMFFFCLKFFTRFLSSVFVQSNHYIRGNAHAFFLFQMGNFSSFQRLTTLLVHS